MAVELILISAHFSDACCKADPDRFPCDCDGFVCYNEAVLGIDILIIPHLKYMWLIFVVAFGIFVYLMIHHKLISNCFPRFEVIVHPVISIISIVTFYEFEMTAYIDNCCEKNQHEIIK